MSAEGTVHICCRRGARAAPMVDRVPRAGQTRAQATAHSRPAGRAYLKDDRGQGSEDERRGGHPHFVIDGVLPPAGVEADNDLGHGGHVDCQRGVAVDVLHGLDRLCAELLHHGVLEEKANAKDALRAHEDGDGEAQLPVPAGKVRPRVALLVDVDGRKAWRPRRRRRRSGGQGGSGARPHADETRHTHCTYRQRGAALPQSYTQSASRPLCCRRRPFWWA